MISKQLIILISALVLGGCATMGTMKFVSMYGESEPRNREVDSIGAGHVDYWSEVKPVLEQRCVVCHACYDAPCQLKLGSIEGIERGATTAKVYNPSRIRSTSPTRLFEDAHSVEEWRKGGFSPVLNEHNQTPQANREAGTFYQMLELKKAHPLPEAKYLSDEFALGLDDARACPKPSEFEKYALKTPLLGMPYALPGLTDDEHSTVERWLEQGATYTRRKPLVAAYQNKIDHWETFLNGNSNKQRLMSRYIYEHLFLGHIFFDDIKSLKYFKLVRSATPPGKPVELISTRRPYDDPEVDRVYYRLQEDFEAVVAKTHIPYAFNSKRMDFWQEIFIDYQYDVSSLPSYDVSVASNPFLAYVDIPVNSRYRFLLDEAQFTVRGFIKGPVCRGQVALNVIRDHFWVFFIPPNDIQNKETADFFRENYDLLELPSTQGDILRPLTHWRRYSKKQVKYFAAKDQLLVEHFSSNDRPLDLGIVWDGDAVNDNASLTVFRHFDSATVEKGLLGYDPKTAWLLGYADLERIHYLLVAGYDVYGNIGHQLFSRLYMDFLRMSGESNLLLLLPQEERAKVRDDWYRNSDPELLQYMSSPMFEKSVNLGITYTTDSPKGELFTLLKKRLSKVLPDNQALVSISDKRVATELERLNQLQGLNLRYLPEHAIILLERSDGDQMFTLMRNSAHSNMTSMFSEQKNRIPNEDGMLVLEGVVGSYPGAFFKLSEDSLNRFVTAIGEVDSEQSYEKLRDTFGVRRTDPNFWQFSDRIHKGFKKAEPLEYGILDYNRLENR